MAKLLIMCLQESDLSRLLSSCFDHSEIVALNAPADLERFDAFAILGGTRIILLQHFQSCSKHYRSKEKKENASFVSLRPERATPALQPLCPPIVIGLFV